MSVSATAGKAKTDKTRFISLVRKQSRVRTCVDNEKFLSDRIVLHSVYRKTSDKAGSHLNAESRIQAWH